jgi:hypothetical protein
VKEVPFVSPRNIAVCAGRRGGIRELWRISSACHPVEQFFRCDPEGGYFGYRILHPTPRFCHRRRVLERVMVLCLMIAFTMRAGERPGEWTGPYPVCDGHTEVLKREPMNLGVRFSTSNPRLAVEFARAMTFWASILEMNWHEEDNRACAIQVVDGDPGLFRPAEAARAQFPGTPAFQGWIAFNSRVSLPSNDLFLIAVHELGHVLGLPHSSNVSSVMYFLALDGPVFLDSADLAALAARHRLRARAGTVDVPESAVQSWRRVSP